MSAVEAEVRRLERELARQNRLVDAAYALHTTLDLDALLGLILQAARDGVDADRGTVFLLSDDGREIWSRVLSGDGALVIRLPLGRGIAGAVAETGETIRIDDAHADPRFDASWDLKSGYRTRTILCAPIRARDGRIAGVFQLLNKRGGLFTEEDETFLAALSVHAALAVENARLHRDAIEKERQDREILLVQHVQRAFQPERADSTFGPLHIAGMNELCEDASGDYYDLIELRDGRVAVAIGDVAGHGLGSAIVMAQARATLRAFCHSMDDLAGVMNLLNDFLCRDMTRGKFITLFVARLDPSTSTMEWCNAGNLPPLLLRADGTVERLEANGRVMGVLPEAGYEVQGPLAMHPGDRMLLYTDGATEATAPDDEQFGEARLEKVLRDAGADPVRMLDAVRAALLSWTGVERLKDDLTLLAIHAQEPAA